MKYIHPDIQAIILSVKKMKRHWEKIPNNSLCEYWASLCESLIKCIENDPQSYQNLDKYLEGYFTLEEEFKEYGVHVNEQA